MELGGSLLLQALGWATLNSIWQMGLLWCLYQLVALRPGLSSNRRYLLALYSLGAGVAWTAWTFFSYCSSGQPSGLLTETMLNGRPLLPSLLRAASVAYLVLLVVPALRVVRNWRYLRTIRRNGITKAPARFRLFVDNLARPIGVGKKVCVYISSLVTSPVTIGYLKPIILIPIAALNSLTPTQMEAVLLHELSHIRRYDYLVNLFLAALQVVLYFNPFVRLFLRVVESERENCCDELVLRFEYDKLSYASALVELQKAALPASARLAMAATQSNTLLARIERIVGLQRKPRLQPRHFAGAFLAGFFVLILHSLIAITPQRQPAGFINNSEASYAFLRLDGSASPFRLPPDPVPTLPDVSNLPAPPPPPAETAANLALSPAAEPAPDAFVTTDDSLFRQVAYTEPQAALTEQQSADVNSAVANARRMLEVQWSQVERAVPDGFTPAERVEARREYLSQVRELNWKRFEQNLKASAAGKDFARINAQINMQIAQARLDSLQGVYRTALSELDRLSAAPSNAAPLPDVSVSEIGRARESLQRQIKEIDRLRGRAAQTGSVKL